jgi:hypothetical protein
MLTSFCAYVGSISLAASSTIAGNGCGAELRKSFLEAQHIVDSLRLDKPGQMRVFAEDGSEYTGGQALWMKGRLRDVSAACKKGDTASAVLH